MTRRGQASDNYLEEQKAQNETIPHRSRHVAPADKSKVFEEADPLKGSND